MDKRQQIALEILKALLLTRADMVNYGESFCDIDDFYEKAVKKSLILADLFIERSKY